MSSITLNRRTRKFLDSHVEKAFGSRDMEVDEMIADLASDGRSTRIH